MAGLTEDQMALLEKALTGKLTPEEQRTFQALLAEDPQIRKEWDSLKTLHGVTTHMKFGDPPEETWDRYWAGVYARIERGLAWLLISLGTAVLLAVGGYRAVSAFFEDQTTPLFMKVAIAAVVLGGAILLVSIAREKWILWKSDKYKEVVR